MNKIIYDYKLQYAISVCHQSHNFLGMMTVMNFTINVLRRYMLTDKQGGCTIVLYPDFFTQIWTKFEQNLSKESILMNIYMLTSPPFLGILGSTACNATPSSTHFPELFSSSSSVSRRKLAQAMSSVPESDLLPNTPSFEETVDLMGGLTTPIGFRLVDMSILHTAVSWLQCPDYTDVDTLELLEGAERQGLVSKLIIRCYSPVYM